MPSFSRGGEHRRILAHRHEGVLQRLGAVGRHAGRRRERQRDEELQVGEIEQRLRARVLGQLVGGRDVGKVGMPGLAAELHQRAKGVLVPQSALAGAHRAIADDLAVDLAALHGQEHRRRAAIAAHDLDVEAEDFLGDGGEDHIA